MRVKRRRKFGKKVKKNEKIYKNRRVKKSVLVDKVESGADLEDVI